MTNLPKSNTVNPVGREPIDADALLDALGERWARIAVVAETGSTNADLLADAAAPDRSALIAEVQTAGRGRLDRSWVSPPGAGLTLSALFRPSVPVARWGWLPLLAGVALTDAVGAGALKWPNDLLLGPGERKAAGILAQSGGDAVVIGIGINVDTAAHEFDGLPEATSLAIEGIEVTRTDLAIALLTRLDSLMARWQDVAGDAQACGLAAAYRAACSTIGRAVTLTAGDGTSQEGTVRDVDPDGHLLLDVDGVTRTIAAGDVQHLRSI